MEKYLLLDSEGERGREGGRVWEGMHKVQDGVVAFAEIDSSFGYLIVTRRYYPPLSPFSKILKFGN